MDRRLQRWRKSGHLHNVACCRPGKDDCWCCTATANATERNHRVSGYAISRVSGPTCCYRSHHSVGQPRESRSRNSQITIMTKREKSKNNHAYHNVIKLKTYTKQDQNQHVYIYKHCTMSLGNGIAVISPSVMVIHIFMVCWFTRSANPRSRMRNTNADLLSFTHSPLYSFLEKLYLLFPL